MLNVDVDNDMQLYKYWVVVGVTMNDEIWYVVVVVVVSLYVMYIKKENELKNYF